VRGIVISCSSFRWRLILWELITHESYFGGLRFMSQVGDVVCSVTLPWMGARRPAPALLVHNCVCTYVKSNLFPYPCPTRLPPHVLSPVRARRASLEGLLDNSTQELDLTPAHALFFFFLNYAFFAVDRKVQPFTSRLLAVYDGKYTEDEQRIVMFVYMFIEHFPPPHKRKTSGSGPTVHRGTGDNHY
jgi:hypothetical protein